MHIAVGPLLLIVLIGAAVGLWFLVKHLASQDGAQVVGIFTMIATAIGKKKEWKCQQRSRARPRAALPAVDGLYVR